MKPLIMHAENVLKIVEGVKTRTRRIVKEQPEFPGNWEELYWESEKRFREGAVEHCWYGKIGDRLRIGEKHMRSTVETSTGVSRAVEYGDGTKIPCSYPQVESWTPWRWRAPFLLPVWACRATIEITGVHVERVQEITVAGALEEGAESVQDFHDRWLKVNGPWAWDRNPLVWVLGFRRL